jgi:flagellar motor switch protein FliN/FliY
MSEAENAGATPPMDILLDIPLQLSVELGRTRMTVSEVLRLGRGSVVELTKAAGEALDIFVNDRLVARGEAVVVGERYGVRITEIHNVNERARAGARAEG